MSTPPTPTLLLLNLPPSILCGIDLLTFTTSPTFHGIKSLPPGLHFLFTSPSASLSLRDGFWFRIPTPTSPTPLIYRKWDPARETLVPCPEDEARAFVAEKGGWKEVYEKHLTPYRQSANTDGKPQSEDTWEHLTAHVTPALLTRFTQNPEWAISSASSGLQDRDEIPGLSAKEVGDVIGEEQELGMLGVELKKTWREGAVGRERTEQARDRSWVVGDVVARHTGGSAAGAGDEGPWESVILGQMEVCFLMVLTLANYSCLEEWKRVLAVVLTCEKAVWEKPRFFAGFLRLLRRQLERGDDVEGGLFDMSDDGGAFLKELLKRFNRTLRQRRANPESIDDDTTEEFQEVAKWVKEQYGWELGDEFVRRGMLELEDGEMVEMETGEMAGEDESGEYAPVIVEL
ncbi:MAG: hypothetical protein LQ344_000855 [Seirophora lacunosa]|nr:MAG: hypothetical protein LQ344_000855 [Seirophora lacunosa]